MDDVISEGTVRVGADSTGCVIQVHAVTTAGRLLTRNALARDKLSERCLRLPANGVVTMKASSSAHH